MKKISILTSLLLAFAFLGFACKEKDEDNTALLAAVLYLSNGIKVNSVSDLVNESNADYTKNEYGLIEASKLETWVSDWTANKPSHISGKLIILQTDAADRYEPGTKGSYIKADAAKGVYVYHLDDYQTGGTSNFRFNQTRDSGLIKNSVRYQANGTYVDEWLKAFGIDLSKDLVVFAVGTTTTLISGSATGGTQVAYDTAANKGTYASGVQDIARGVYWLRYWGADIKHLAILNGNLYKNFNNASLLSSTRSTIPNNNSGFSVKQLRVDNTALTLGLEDIYEIAKSDLKASLSGITSTQFLIDARPSAQFNGTVTTIGTPGAYFITTSWGFSGAPNAAANPAQKFVLFEGGIKGAVDFPWVDLLGDSTTGFKFVSKDSLKTIFTNKGYIAGKTVISQCRTNFEAQVNGFAALNVLGYPTAFYDGSLVEWTSVAATHPSSEFNKVTSSFKWRTDSDTVSRILWYNGTAADITRTQAAEIDPTATTTKKFIQEDKAYKY
ncbi:sulfurtransferase [Leptospira ilyithenensis]|uniref:Sulfurtransferase n=1 Tax=Leptospira ilyithenensis TaxID=2484901 RepID=A0A4R9LLU0_9LEPT|nr:sulfurtransferase [Leptospira ilyithenensis]TGN07134.1 sulfurtransferase [Leptospira ilyithenensis]